MIPEDQSTLIFFVNGKKVVDNQVNPEWTLLYYLRRKLQLCGTKLGCAEGGCGACTVMVSKYDRKRNKVMNYVFPLLKGPPTDSLDFAEYSLGITALEKMRTGVSFRERNTVFIFGLISHRQFGLELWILQ